MLRRTAKLLALLAAPALAQDADFFEKKIRPLLDARCIECHGDKKAKGGLRLDSREGWAKGGDSGPAIVPGKPDESLLIKAVRYTDTDLQMPEKRKLPDTEIVLLEQWVKMGAPDPRTGAAVAKKQTGMSVEEGRKFWAYVPPKKPALPAVKDEAWPRGTIDRFILAKLEAGGKRPAPDAAPEVLTRRLSFALTGLPPAPDQIAEARDSSFVIRHSSLLLRSPHFAERFAQHWLDVARFAESSGGGRTLLYKDAWRYRDYVIESFRDNVPFDRFLREQIAGDLLPASSPEQRARQLAATAFLALGPTNYEEQDKQQLRFDVIDEQLDTIGKTVLGQTLGCARCHDHKFDPLPQRDYYALAGILASTRTLHNYTDNVARWVDVPLPVAPAEEEKLRAHEEKLAAAKKELEAAKDEQKRLAKLDAPKDDKPGTSITAASLPGIIVDDDDAKIVGTWKESVNFPRYIARGYRHDGNAEKGKLTMTFVPKIPAAGRYEVRLAYIHAPGRATKAPVHIFHADGENEVSVDQSQPPTDGRFVSLGTFRFEKDGAGYVLITNEGTDGYVTADAVQFFPEGERSAPATPERGELAKAKSRVKELASAVKKLEDGPRRPLAMAVREEPGDVGGTHIRVRGVVHNKGELVPRGFLTVLGSADGVAFPEKESGRVQLANWLATHPLAARVYVNRVWHWLFGEGLVRSVDNFGTTGDAPAHPELLDWLAVEFIEHGWDVKWLVREIVTSRSWSSGFSLPGAQQPKGWTPAARRLDANQLRDAMLTVSGELDLRALGPNIAGAGEIDANDTSSQNIEYRYEFTDTRRSIYTPAFRNRRHEIFEVFDFANINAPLGARHASTVAPQALYLLNHPWVIERSRKAAARFLAMPGDDAQRIERAYLAALARTPRDGEKTKLLAFLTAAGAGEKERADAWSQVFQTIFASLDFRFIE